MVYAIFTRIWCFFRQVLLSQAGPSMLNFVMNSLSGGPTSWAPRFKPGLCKNRSPVLKNDSRSGPTRKRAGVTGGFAKNMGWRGV